MIIILAIIGLPITIIGFIITTKRFKISHYLNAQYDIQNAEYDRKFANTTPVKKVVGFLLFRPGNYIHNDNSTANALLFLGPLCILWGIGMILLGLGVIR